MMALTVDQPGGLVTRVMNVNSLSRSLPLVLTAALFACGGQEVGASSQGIAEAKRSVGGMYVCDIPVPPGTFNLDYVIPEVEMDRVYTTARPGFIREWAPGGWRNGQLFSQLLMRFDTVEHTNEFADWLGNDFLIDGGHFWDRPDFTLGYDCHVWEVLGAEDRPTTNDTQVTLRVERFPASGPNVRQQLGVWYEEVKNDSRRRGDTSVFMLYSEELQQGSIIAFQSVPEAERIALAPVPVEAQPPLASGDTFDWSGWNFTIWFPYEWGDHGRPGLWPLPGISASATDGVCEISRHETWRNTTDCLRTCGNGAADPGETVHNCPSDVAAH